MTPYDQQEKLVYCNTHAYGLCMISVCVLVAILVSVVLLVATDTDEIQRQPVYCKLNYR